jgi:hypothetical protein
VPVLLALAMPWPWRSRELLAGISRSMANLSMSPAVRQEVTEQGGWKSLLALVQTSDETVRRASTQTAHPSPSLEPAVSMSIAFLMSIA